MGYVTTCPECGGSVSPQRKAGRTMHNKNMPSVVLPEDLEIPTCDGCGEQFYDQELAEKVDAILADAYSHRIVGVKPMYKRIASVLCHLAALIVSQGPVLCVFILRKDIPIVLGVAACIVLGATSMVLSCISQDFVSRMFGEKKCDC